MDRGNLHSAPDFRKGDDEAERVELQRLAPTLFAIPNEEPFEVPAHFFDQLPHAVQAVVVERSEKQAFPWIWRIAIAAPIAAVLLGAWWFMRDTSVPQGIQTVTMATAPSVDDLDGLEEDDLFAALVEEDVHPDAVTLDLTDDEVLEYLEQENMDLDELISEL